MRALVLALAIGTLGLPAFAQTNVVDLNRPGALDAVARENPRHYQEILKISRVAAEVSCETALRMMPVPVAGAKTPCVGTSIMTSDPPKRRISFEIDAVRYAMVVTLNTPPGRFLPAN